MRQQYGSGVWVSERTEAEGEREEGEGVGGGKMMSGDELVALALLSRDVHRYLRPCHLPHLLQLHRRSLCYWYLHFRR